MTLPPRVRNEVQRILDTEARRLLADQLDTNPVDPAAPSDRDASDHRSDKRAARIERKRIPVRRGDNDSGAAAA